MFYAPFAVEITLHTCKTYLTTFIINSSSPLSQDLKKKIEILQLSVVQGTCKNQGLIFVHNMCSDFATISFSHATQ